MRIEVVPYDSVAYKHSLMVRDNILRKPLGMELANVDIYDEDKHVHFVVIEDDSVVGVVVLVPFYKGRAGKLRQMATLEHVRGKGYGKALVWQLERYAKRSGMDEILLNARYHAVSFYERIGYEVCSDVFQEVGMDHYQMRKRLA